MATRQEIHIADEAIVIFAGQRIGHLASGVTLTPEIEKMYHRPGNQITDTDGVTTAENYMINMTIHNVRPKHIAYLRGQSVNQYQKTTLADISASANVPVLRFGQMGSSAGAGVELSSGVRTSTVKLYNQDFQEVSGAADGFAAADWTVSGTKLYKTGSIITQAVFPVAVYYEKAGATARRASFGSRAGLFIGELDIAFFLKDGQAKGLRAFRANPTLQSVVMKGNKASEMGTVEVTFKLLADPSRNVGNQIFEFVESDF